MAPAPKAGPGRPSVSCSVCRKRKLKSDRQHPCRNCLRSRSKNPQRDCVHDDAPLLESARSRHRRTSVSLLQRRMTPSSTPGLVSPASGHASSDDADALVVPRLLVPAVPTSRLHAAVSATTQSYPSASEPHSVRGPKSLVSEVCSAHQPVESAFFGNKKTGDRGVTHKSRFFGQSHWLTTIMLFRDLAQTIAADLSVESSTTLSAMRKCKALAKEIKVQRTPIWPAPLKAALPAKDLADELLNSYLN